MRSPPLVSSSSVVVGGTAVDTAALAASSILVARVLSPADVGSYYLALSTVTILAGVAQLGMNRAVLRVVGESLQAGEPRRAAGLTWRALGIASAGAATAGAGVALVFATIVSGGDGQAWLVGGLVGTWLFSDTVRTVAAEAHRAWGSHGRAALYGNPARSVLLLAALTAVLVLGGSLELVLLLTVVAAAVPLLAGSALLPRPREGRVPAAGARLLRLGLVVAVVAAANQLLNQGDVWVIGALRDQGDVATYAAALRLVLVAGVPQVAANAIVGPLIVRFHHRRDPERLEAVLRLFATVTLVPAALTASVFAIAGPSLLGAVFGSFYRDGSVVLVLLGVGLVARSATGSCGLALLLTGHERLVLLVTSVAALVVLALEAVLGARYGMAGVATASGLGVAVHELGLAVLSRRVLGVRCWVFASPRSLVAAYRLVRGDG